MIQLPVLPFRPQVAVAEEAAEALSFLVGISLSVVDVEFPAEA